MFEKFERHPDYERFARDVPRWYGEAKLGIFIHWGVFSVPAWAEPVGELGNVDFDYWFPHNPYSEWYANTIRLPGSPAQRHHQEHHGGAPYDAFLDEWSVEDFDPDEWMRLIAGTGARYVIQTTKHHDGICRWDAPGTQGFNAVHRGPRRDVIGEIADATRRAGLKFGTYYSTGLDWRAADVGPVTRYVDDELRPRGPEYSAYTSAHMLDLINRYTPDVLWGDIGWPDAGIPDGPTSLTRIFDAFYEASPEGVVNDRFGATHWDFRTSEYQFGGDMESDAWENCRGIGYSFGYNQVEGPEHHLDGTGAVKHLLDVVSRGGNFLLNVGPTASGAIPDLQRSCLEGLANWMAHNAGAVHGTTPVEAHIASPSNPAAEARGDAWVRWTRSGGTLYAVVDSAGSITLPDVGEGVDLTTARLWDGTPLRARRGGTSNGRSAVIEVPELAAANGPAVIVFALTPER